MEINQLSFWRSWSSNLSTFEVFVKIKNRIFCLDSSGGRKKMSSSPRVVIDGKYVIETESQSFFINNVISLFAANKRNSLTLRLPYGLETYWEKIKKLNKLPHGILGNPSYWIYNTKIVDENVAVRSLSEPYEAYNLYDVFDRGLCIAFIDQHTYRHTLAVCIELFLRRQLKEYSDHFDLNGCHIRSVVRYQNLHFALPQLCITSNNPDDIRKLDVIVDKKKYEKLQQQKKKKKRLTGGRVMMKRYRNFAADRPYSIRWIVCSCFSIQVNTHQTILLRKLPTTYDHFDLLYRLCFYLIFLVAHKKIT